MYLLSVLDSVSPGAFDTTRSLLLAAELPPVAQLARTLANDLVKIKEPFVLVLDDFHKIHDKAIHELLGVLLKHPPESLQLILVTRRDLPLLTSTLRGRGQIHEIGAADLHFSVEETSRFLKNVTGLSIDAQKVATIQQRLEGWPAGIRLIAQSLKDTGDMDRVLAGLHGGFATIVDYLWNEVLSNQSPVMAKLMSAAAVPNQFCASLCDALIKATSQPDMAKMDGDEFIARQQKENLFLIPLDSFNQWFRYHHMFQELLRNQLHKLWQPEEIAALHSQANAWLVDNNITDAALVKSLNAFRVQADATVFSVNSEKASVPHEPRASSLSPPPLVDPLTNRELDVLSLLAQRFSNKEIADQLCISTTTVKGHLQNIYGKLAVNKRREAIDRANKLGII
jgi:LuxR family maltose regulon positive regulatory protein